MVDRSASELNVAPGAPRGPAETRRAAQVAARRHSTLVRVLKFVLPVLAGLGAVVLGARALLYTYAPDLKLPTVLFSQDGLTMVEPRLSGRSRERAYEVTAARAVQSLEDPKKVRLERLDGRVELADKSWAKLEAKSGLYDGTRETLKLEDGLSVTTSNGYRIGTSLAEIDLSTGRMNGPGAIRIEGPIGVIEAGNLQVEDNGRSFTFGGGVRMTFVPAAADATAAEVPTAEASGAAVAPAPPPARSP